MTGALRSGGTLPTRTMSSPSLSAMACAEPPSSGVSTEIQTLVQRMPTQYTIACTAADRKQHAALFAQLEAEHSADATASSDEHKEHMYERSPRTSFLPLKSSTASLIETPQAHANGTHTNARRTRVAGSVSPGRNTTRRAQPSGLSSWTGGGH
jgi:hypothetical protein